MKKNAILLTLLFAINFIGVFAQLNLKVMVENIRVINSVNCDGGLDKSDFVFEFKATDNSPFAYSNNSPVPGSIGLCNYAVQNEDNGPFSIFTISPGTAIFSPTTGVFFDRNYNCKQDVPSIITIVWRGYENDDSTTPSILPVASGITSSQSHTVGIVMQNPYVQSLQYTLTSNDGSCPQTYEITLSVAVSYNGTFIPLSMDHVHANIICTGTNNGVVEGHPMGGSGVVLTDWSYDGLGDYDDPLKISGLTAGNYTFVVKDALNCTDTLVASITEVNPPNPIAAYIASTPTLCSGKNNVLYAVTPESNVSYNWNYSGTGAVIASSNNSVTINYSNFAVSGILSVYAQNSCSVTPTLTIAVIVIQTPTVNISGNTVMCGNTQETLTASGAPSFSWSTGANTASIAITPTTTSVYMVTGNNSGCSASKQFTMNVVSAPTVQINGPTSSVCPSHTVALTALGTGNTYIWSDGFIGTNRVVSSPSTVIYTVTNTYTNSCFAQSTYTLLVNPTPTITVTGGGVVCPGKTTTLIASGSDTFNWSQGASTASITYTPSGLTTLIVIGTNSLTGCANSATVSVDNFSTGNLSITGNTVICSNTQQVYTAGGFDFYLWDNGSTGATNTITPVVSTTISVVGTTNDGCRDSTSLTLNIVDVQIISISGLDTICAGQSTSLTVNATGATSYSWNSGATGYNIAISPSTTFTYIVTASNDGCSAVEAHEVFVKSTPSIDFSITGPLCVNDIPLSLTATPSGGTYMGPGISGNTFDPSIGAGIHYISYELIGVNSCSAISTRSIEVAACVGIRENENNNIVNFSPNPASSYILINSHKIIRTITLYDYTGKLVKLIETHTIQEELDISKLSKGVYTCYILMEDYTHKTIKVVKE